MDNTDFFNLYVKNLVTEVTELTKSKILLTTQSGFKDAEIAELKKTISDLETAAATEKDQTTKYWQTTLEEKDQEVNKTQNTIIDLRRQLQVKENNLVNLTTKIEELHKEVKNKEDVIANLNEQLRVKEPVNVKRKKNNSVNMEVRNGN